MRTGGSAYHKLSVKHKVRKPCKDPRHVAVDKHLFWLKVIQRSILCAIATIARNELAAHSISRLISRTLKYGASVDKPKFTRLIQSRQSKNGIFVGFVVLRCSGRFIDSLEYPTRPRLQGLQVAASMRIHCRHPP